MKIVPPLEITDARLTSSTAVETAPAAYNGGTTYALNATASVAGAAGLLTVYKSLQAGNTGHTPASSPTWWQSLGETYQVYSGGATYALDDYVIDATAHYVYRSLTAGNIGQALTNDTKWQLIGPTNKAAMFDLLWNTPTIQPLQIVAVVTPGTRVDAIGVTGLAGTEFTIVQTVLGVETFSHTENLTLREVDNWYDYFFQAFGVKSKFAVFDVPPYANAVFTLTCTAGSGDAEVGAVVFGMQEEIGDIQVEADDTVDNYSTVERTFDGNLNVASLTQRRNVAKTIQQIFAPKTYLRRLRRLRDALNGVPALIVGIVDNDDPYSDSFALVGIIQRFSINAKHHEYIVISMDVEEI